MRGFVITREMHLLGKKNPVKIASKKTDAVVYLYTNRAGKPAAIAFRGKANKPAFDFYFSSEKRREERVRDFFQAYASHDEFVKSQRAATNRPGELVVDNILVWSGGYEQTNVEFYLVTAVISEHMVEIVRIGSTETKSGPNYSGYCIANPTHRGGEPMRKRVTNGTTVKIGTKQWAYRWDGREQYFSSGH